MSIAEEVRAAAKALRDGLSAPHNATSPLAELLEHIGDDMEDERAYEASAGPGDSATTVVFTDRRVLRSDWTAALATARAINGTPADATTGGA